MAGVLGFAGFGLAIFALISSIIAIALDYWTYTDNGTSTGYRGLWKICSDGKKCNSITDVLETDVLKTVVLSDYKVVRAMVILGLLLDFAGLVCGALKLFMMKEKKVVGLATAGLLVVAGLFLLVGFAVYVDKIYNPDKKNSDTSIYKKNDSDTTSLHAGFAFCVIAWLASWAGGVLFGVATLQDKD